MHHRTRRQRMFFILAAVTVNAVLVIPAFAEDVSANFSQILQKHTRSAFRAVSAYIEENPDAADVERAYQWFFTTARAHGLETDAMSVAEAYLKRPRADQSARPLALEVRSLGLAQSGKMAEALAVFEDHLRLTSIRNPNSALNFGLALVVQAQLSNDRAAAREIFGLLSDKFFLNPYVRRLCETRLDKLDLAGEAAPTIGTSDLNEKPIDLSDYSGKVVLVDFWATNCAPCLAEVPGMKQLYGEYHEKGFEVIGITLDEDQPTVDEFQRKWKLPWRLSFSRTDGDATRKRYKVVTIPSLFLLDRKGNIAYVDVRGADLRRAVETLLKGKN